MGCTHVRTLEPPVPWYMVYSSVNKGRYTCKDKLQLLYIMITIIEFHLLVVTIYISGTLTLQL